ncbi:MAG: CPBP family intramembrane metalloprotease, partial [Planctomycetes bacterium]|nr:CPBP family intramembrane metalloprotease [Planctomycetota bacterium]
MRWKNVKLIFMREAQDQLRDRRTLFMVVVLPLLMYPAMGIGVMQMSVIFREEPRTVVVLGTKYLPDAPKLIEKDRFATKLFLTQDFAPKLIVVSDIVSENDSDVKFSSDQKQLLKQAQKIRERHRRRVGLEEKQKNALAEKDPVKLKAITQELEQVNRDLSRIFQKSGIQVLLLVPDEFSARIDLENRLIAERKALDRENGDLLHIPVIHNKANRKSQIAFHRVRDVLDIWRGEILEQRLELADLPSNLTIPFHQKNVDLASEDELSDSLWSSFFPAILVIMAVTGAFYPAIDLAAGEKERGTMETLLICPASRTEIVLGKFFTVMLFSMSTALLNLISMGLTGKYVSSIMLVNAIPGSGGLAMPSLLPLFWVVILLLPLAALFSALCLALATFARSSKEGQYYLTPLLMVTLGLTMFCLSPGVEIQPFYSVLPVIGPALLLKELFLSPGAPETLIYILPVLITSVGYSLLALWWAIDLFSREEVLFRESERFELRLWVRHLLRDKEPTPNFAEAGFCFVMIILLQFASLKFFANAFLAAGSSAKMLQLQMISLLVTIAFPALIMGTMLTTSVIRTFRLRLPRWNLLAAAVILPVVLHPLSVEMLAYLQDWFFRNAIPPEAAKMFAFMSDKNLSVWYILLAIAVTPAICEEVAFRGFILSGLSRNKRTGLAIVFSSLAFGIIHMIPQQVFNATLLGLVLGLLTIRSNSLIPAITFHFIYNSLQV